MIIATLGVILAIAVAVLMLIGNAFDVITTTTHGTSSTQINWGTVESFTLLFGKKNDNGDVVTKGSTLALISWILALVGVIGGLGGIALRCSKKSFGKVVLAICGLCLVAAGVMVFFTGINFRAANNLKDGEAFGIVTKYSSKFSWNYWVAGIGGILGGVSLVTGVAK